VRVPRVPTRRLSISTAVPLLAVAASGSALAADSPPITPDNLVANVYGATAGAVRWDRSSDDRLVVGYDVFRDGRRLGTFFEVIALNRQDRRSSSARLFVSTARNDGTEPGSPRGGRDAEDLHRHGRRRRRFGADVRLHPSRERRRDVQRRLVESR